MRLLKCSGCGAEVTPGPATCPQCGTSLKTAVPVQPPGASERLHVIVTDVRIPFWSMANLLITWALAATPALFILACIGALLAVVLTFLFGPAFM